MDKDRDPMVRLRIDRTTRGCQEMPKKVQRRKKMNFSQLVFAVMAITIIVVMVLGSVINTF